MKKKERAGIIMNLWTDVKGTKLFYYAGNNQREAIKETAKIIREGGLVAFPTETVYGLGADAFCEQAIERIFNVKGRPLDNPLIVHLSDISQLELIAKEPPLEAKKLGDKFWPGPLTLVLQRKEEVTSVASAGLSTVAVRIPAHKAALDLIGEARTPIAAPSANISGRPSPTDPSHVEQDLAGKIDAILDGGVCSIGIESTVVDLTGKEPVLLRPGGVNVEHIESCLCRPVLRAAPQNSQKPSSPGMKYRHYAPKNRLILFRGLRDTAQNNMITYYESFISQNKNIGVLCSRKIAEYFPQAVVETWGERDNAQEAALFLYRKLRDLDRAEIDIILVEGFQEEGIGLALMDRLQKAADQIIEG